MWNKNTNEQNTLIYLHAILTFQWYLSLLTHELFTSIVGCFLLFVSQECCMSGKKQKREVEGWSLGLESRAEMRERRGEATGPCHLSRPISSKKKKRGEFLPLPFETMSSFSPARWDERGSLKISLESLESPMTSSTNIKEVFSEH